MKMSRQKLFNDRVIRKDILINYTTKLRSFHIFPSYLKQGLAFTVFSVMTVKETKVVRIINNQNLLNLIFLMRVL